MHLNKLLTVASVAVVIPNVLGGIITYGICQTGCNSLAVACYAAAGAQFGTVLAPAAPASIVACNAALGTCMTACAAIALTNPV